MVSEWADVWELEDFSNAYRNWMQSKMGAKEYGVLFDLLHDMEFRWSPDIPRDADRAADGRYLRLRFSIESGMEIEEEWLEWPCSFLEFLIALSYSIDDKIMYSAENPDQAKEWFWEILENLDLAQYDDARMHEDGTLGYSMVVERVNMVMDRRYGPNGHPGMFPLRNASFDQRSVEIWYQANEYMMEEYIG